LQEWLSRRLRQQRRPAVLRAVVVAVEVAAEPEQVEALVELALREVHRRQVGALQRQEPRAGQPRRAGQPLAEPEIRAAEEVVVEVVEAEGVAAVRLLCPLFPPLLFSSWI
jgi:hypothetical protein